MEAYRTARTKANTSWEWMLRAGNSDGGSTAADRNGFTGKSTSYKNGFRDALETIRLHFSRLEPTAMIHDYIITRFSPQEGHEEEYVRGYRAAINETRQRLELDYNDNMRKHEARGRVMRRITEIELFYGAPEFIMRLDCIRLAMLNEIEAELGLD